MIDNPRKVLHVLNSAGGGAALSTIDLIESLRLQGVEACAVCHDGGTDDEKARLREAVRGELLITPLYWWNRKVRSPWWKRPLSEVRQLMRTGCKRGSVRQVAERAQKWNAELIHTNTIVTPEGGIAAGKLELPHVWHLRELVGPGHPFRFWVEGPAFGRYVSRYCDKLIANSDVTAEQVKSWLPPGLLAVVPNGIDVERFIVRDRPAVPGKVVVAMVASLNSRWKNHRLFIKTASQVNRDLPIEWRIYGHDPTAGGTGPGDPYVDQLRATVCSAGLEDRFRWPGFVADPAQIMAEIDVMLHPTVGESFGRVVVEAMAAGLPVVGVRGGGVGRIVEHDVTGLLAAPEDDIELARHVERLAGSQELRQTMGKAGRRRAEHTYSLEACAAGVLNIYREVLHRQAVDLPAMAGSNR